MNMFPSLKMIDDRVPHSLLERPTPTPTYSDSTMRRAFIVWLYCGQRNRFPDVCTFFHHLETMEEKLSPARRAASRHLELKMYFHQPPTSPFQAKYYPTLYSWSTAYVDVQYKRKLDAIKKEIVSECVEHFKKMEKPTNREIVEASEMIQEYCKTHLVALRQFLDEFKEYAAKSEMKVTVSNVSFYIKRKIVHEDLRITACYQNKYSLIKLAAADQHESPRNFESDMSAARTARNIDTVKAFADLDDKQMKLLLGVSAKCADTVGLSVSGLDRKSLKGSDDARAHGDPVSSTVASINVLRRDRSVVCAPTTDSFHNNHLMNIKI